MTPDYNHYADHMNAFISNRGGSVEPELHDEETKQYNNLYGVNVPMLDEDGGSDAVLEYFVGGPIQITLVPPQRQ